MESMTATASTQPGGEPLVIMTSDEPHGDIGNSHQHYFDVVSAKYDTVFVQPPGRWNPRTWFGPRGLVVHSDRSALFQYVNYFPVTVMKIFFTRLNDLINSWFLSRCVDRSRCIIWWKFDSFRMMTARFMPSAGTIYHVVDPVFRKVTDPYVARSADLIVVVNRAYFDQYRRYGKRMIYMPHGIRSEDLVPEPEKADALRRTFGDYLLVTGSINNDTNLDLLRKLADRFPAYTLLLVGNSFLRDPEKVARFDDLLSRPNVRFTGVVHYLALKHYVAAARVCLVPYLSLREGFFRNPIKITNYIAQYKPVVNSVRMTELDPLEGKALFTATDDDGFIDRVARVLDGSLQVDRAFLQRYLGENNYAVLVDKILHELEAVTGQALGLPDRPL